MPPDTERAASAGPRGRQPDTRGDPETSAAAVEDPSAWKATVKQRGRRWYTSCSVCRDRRVEPQPLQEPFRRRSDAVEALRHHYLAEHAK